MKSPAVTFSTPTSWTSSSSSTSAPGPPSICSRKRRRNNGAKNPPQVRRPQTGQRPVPKRRRAPRRLAGSKNCSRARIVLSDGASESAFARQWSEALAWAYLPTARSRPTGTRRSGCPSPRNCGAGKCLGTACPWHGRAKTEAGAHATLLGISVAQTPDETGARPLAGRSRRRHLPVRPIRRRNRGLPADRRTTVQQQPRPRMQQPTRQPGTGVESAPRPRRPPARRPADRRYRRPQPVDHRPD